MVLVSHLAIACPTQTNSQTQSCLHQMGSSTAASDSNHLSTSSTSVCFDILANPLGLSAWWCFRMLTSTGTVRFPNWVGSFVPCLKSSMAVCSPDNVFALSAASLASSAFFLDFFALSFWAAFTCCCFLLLAASAVTSAVVAIHWFTSSSCFNLFASFKHLEHEAMLPEIMLIWRLAALFLAPFPCASHEMKPINVFLCVEANNSFCCCAIMTSKWGEGSNVSVEFHIAWAVKFVMWWNSLVQTHQSILFALCLSRSFFCWEEKKSWTFLGAATVDGAGAPSMFSVLDPTITDGSFCDVKQQARNVCASSSFVSFATSSFVQAIGSSFAAALSHASMMSPWWSKPQSGIAPLSTSFNMQAWHWWVTSVCQRTSLHVWEPHNQLLEKEIKRNH